MYASHLDEPQGLAFDTVNGVTWLYVGESGQISRYAYRTGDTAAPASRQVLVPGLTARLGHPYKDIAIGPDHTVYFGVEDPVNVCVDDVEARPQRAAVYRVNPDGSGLQLFASGLRNPEGLAFVPGTNTLWAAVNNRDEIPYPYKDATGQYRQAVRSYIDDHPPDLFTALRPGGNYGWPFCNSTEDTPVGFNNMPFDTDQDTNSDAHVDCAAMDRVTRGLQAHSARLSAWRSRKPQISPDPTGTGLSSVFTAPGTGRSRPDTKWCTCRSAAFRVSLRAGGFGDRLYWIWCPSRGCGGRCGRRPVDHRRRHQHHLQTGMGAVRRFRRKRLRHRGAIRMRPSTALRSRRACRYHCRIPMASRSPPRWRTCRPGRSIHCAGWSRGRARAFGSANEQQFTGSRLRADRPHAPGLFSMSGDGTGIAAATAVDSKDAVPVFLCTNGSCAGTPITVTGDPVFLSLYGTGIRGAAAGTVQVTANGVGLPVKYAGAQGTYPGLDQINVELQPWMAGGGDFELEVVIGGTTSNAVTVQIQ